MSLVLDEHRQYLADRHRVERYAAALAAVMRPGMTVADVASGTGILGMLACRGGAARVYAIEEGAMAALARELVRVNGFTGRIHVVPAHSSTALLPERVDLVITDQIGRFGFDAGLLGIAADARSRFLVPDGTIIPASVDLIVCPVEHPAQSARVNFWSQRPAGFDFSPAQAIASNTGYPVSLEPRQLLAGPAAGCTLRTASAVSVPLRIERTFTVERDGTVDGIAGWFSARLAAAVHLTNSPCDAERIARRQAFFPIATPTRVASGDRVEVAMQILPDDLIVSWTVRVIGKGGVSRFAHSTLKGMLIDRATVALTDPGYRPVLTDRGDARATVLALCDGRRTLQAIEAETFDRHRSLFETREAAAVFVAEVVTRYTRHAS